MFACKFLPSRNVSLKGVENSENKSRTYGNGYTSCFTAISCSENGLFILQLVINFIRAFSLKSIQFYLHSPISEFFLQHATSRIQGFTMDPGKRQPTYQGPWIGPEPRNPLYIVDIWKEYRLHKHSKGRVQAHISHRQENRNKHTEGERDKENTSSREGERERDERRG